MTRDLGATTPRRTPAAGDEYAQRARAILAAWQAELVEALHAEADRVQRPGLDGLMRADVGEDTAIGTS